MPQAPRTSGGHPKLMRDEIEEVRVAIDKMMAACLILVNTCQELQLSLSQWQTGKSLVHKRVKNGYGSGGAS